MLTSAFPTKGTLKGQKKKNQRGKALEGKLSTLTPPVARVTPSKGGCAAAWKKIDNGEGFNVQAWRRREVFTVKAETRKFATMT